MDSPVMPVQTHYDSIERSTAAEVDAARIRLREHSIITQLLEGYLGMALILDKNRQIVAFNSRAVDVFQGVPADQIYGKRLGEALGCVHAGDADGGCGTTRFCAECGAAQSIRMSRELTHAQARDCRVTTLLQGKEGALNLRVHASPLVIDGEPFTLFTLKDVAHETRLLALERIFFHDVLNTAAAINSIAGLLANESDAQQVSELVGLLRASSWQLIHEIHAQRDLLTAERGELAFVVEPISTARVVSAISELYRSHDLAAGRLLDFAPAKPDVVLETGPVHLIRCLGNLVKNALEATHEGETVRLSVSADSRWVSFQVHNPAVIPESVQLQMFQRSFSTKAKIGRGLGTYSVKLLVEQYLRGQVSFTSALGEGTTFTIRLPRKFRRK